MATRSARFWALGGTAVLLFVVYALSAPRTLPEADAGELAAVAVAGGIPHPPGYPLLVLILQAFAPLGSTLGIVPALSLSSILCACAAAVLLAATLMARRVTPFIAAATASALFLSCNVWRAATTFEPFALNLLLASGLILSCHRLSEATSARESTRDCVMIGALFGLGLCNHHSLATLAPLPLAVLAASPRRAPPRLVAIGVGFVAGCVPLLAFLVLRDQHGWIWGTWRPFWPQLAAHVLRRDYGTLALTSGAHGSWTYGPWRMLATLPGVLSYGFCVALLAGCALGVVRVARVKGTGPEGFALGALAAFVAAGLAFPALFALPGTALDAMIADRFFALPVLLLAFPLARGLAVLEARLLARVAVVLMLALHLVWQWPAASRAEHRFFEAHLRNIFDSVERNATVMTVGDQGFAGGLYARYALHRDDVVMVASGLGYPWYVTWIADAQRSQAGPAGASQAGGRARGPLYLLDVPEARADTELRVYPIGPLLRVVPPGEAMPDAQALFGRNVALFAKLRLPTRAEVLRADAWEADEMRDYSRTWQMLGERLQAHGHRDLAERAFAYRNAFVARTGQRLSARE